MLNEAALKKDKEKLQAALDKLDPCAYIGNTEADLEDVDEALARLIRRKNKEEIKHDQP